MQFLSDVYLRCNECDGKRYGSDILKIYIDLPTVGTVNIDDVLNLTISDSIRAFKDDPKICNKLKPLIDVGLGYLRLGQPVPTLSGGEAQRLKLASYIAEASSGAVEKTIFLLDEPTTGLHYQDVQKLLIALRTLVNFGASVVMVEHNLDLIASCDWIIDLGPEGGEGGGKVVFCGTPNAIVDHQSSLTGMELARLNGGLGFINKDQSPHQVVSNNEMPPRSISIKNARENNLKSICAEIPHEKMTVISGLSGSGKSSLAFDIIYGEGQRRYLESLNAYARQFIQVGTKPDVDAVFGIPPAVAIEQRTSRGGIKSTVGTVTEIYHYLRLLMSKVGDQYCPECDVKIEPQTQSIIVNKLMSDYAGIHIGFLAPLVRARKGVYKDLLQGGPFQQQSFSIKRACPKCQKSYDELDPRMFSFNSKYGWCDPCQGTGQVLTHKSVPVKSLRDEIEAESERDRHVHDEVSATCDTCLGFRLNQQAASVIWKDFSIVDLVSKPVGTLFNILSRIELSDREKLIAKDLLTEVLSRLQFLTEVGLSYLTLNRAAPTLSGGEAQRMRLSAQLGSNLRGAVYVLDEPTIGLHPKDNEVLLKALKHLQNNGNTLVVVEHDEDTINRADFVIDLGPGAGIEGGEIISSGSPEEIRKDERSITGRYLNSPKRYCPSPARVVENGSDSIYVNGATLNNLKSVDVRIPIGRLTLVTGVSGSGKSSLIRGVLRGNIDRFMSSPTLWQNLTLLPGNLHWYLGRS